MHRFFVGVVLCLAQLSLMAVASAQDRQVLRLSAIDTPIYARLYRETFKLLNSHSEAYEFVGHYMPNRRQLLDVNQGIVDGIAIRAGQAIAPDTKLLKISPPLFYADSLIALHVESEDWRELHDLRQLRIGFLSGSSHSTNLLHEAAMTPVNSHRSGLMMLSDKRLDAVSILDLAYYSVLRETPSLQEKIKLASFRTRVPFHLYLHQRRQADAEHVTAIVKRAAEQGQLQRLYEQLVQEVAQDRKP